MSGQYSINGVDLQVGMWITNDSDGIIPIYNDADVNTRVILHISHGEIIGQIHDFKYSGAENWLLFSSGEITAASPWYQMAEQGLADIFLIGPRLFEKATDSTASLLSIYGYVRLVDMQGIPATSIQKQAALLAADPNGTNMLQAKIKKVTAQAGQMAGEAIKSGMTALTSGAGGFIIPAAIIFSLIFLAPRASYKGKSFSYKPN